MFCLNFVKFLKLTINHDVNEAELLFQKKNEVK